MGSCGLQLAEEDIGIGGTTRHESSDRTDEWCEEWECRTCQQHEPFGNVVGHARVIHQHRHRHQTANGHHRLLQIQRGLAQQLHQLTEAHALNQSTDDSTEENHQTCIGQPTELEGVADDGQLELSDQRVIQQFVHRWHNLAGDQDEENDQPIDTPSLEGLGETKVLMLHLHHIRPILFLDEEFVVDEHCDDGSHRTEDGRRLWTNEISATELYDDGE